MSGKQPNPSSSWDSADLNCCLKGKIYWCEPTSPETDISFPAVGRSLSRSVKNWDQTERRCRLLRGCIVVIRLFVSKVTQNGALLWSYQENIFLTAHAAMRQLTLNPRLSFSASPSSSSSLSSLLFFTHYDLLPQPFSFSKTPKSHSRNIFSIQAFKKKNVPLQDLMQLYVKFRLLCWHNLWQTAIALHCSSCQQ